MRLVTFAFSDQTVAAMAKEYPDKPFVINAIKAAIKRSPNLIETRTARELIFEGYKSGIFDSLRSMTPIMRKMGIEKEIPERMAILWDVSCVLL